MGGRKICAQGLLLLVQTAAELALCGFILISSFLRTVI